MRRILLVEDNDMSRDMLKRRLEKKGFRVYTAADGQQGISMASELSPDLILLDLSLPVVDGWEAARKISSQHDTSHIPIIAVTSHAFSEDRSRALDAGCIDFATKPVEFDSLLKKINSLLKGIEKSEAPEKRPSVRPGILIADDDVDFLKLFCSFLESNDFSASTAVNFRQAQEMLESGDFQIAVVDWTLPDGAGTELVKWIRGVFPQIYIIMVTARSEMEDLLTGFASGIDDFLAKPLDFREVLARIKAACRIIGLEKSLREQNLRLVRDLEAGAVVQRSLLPGEVEKFASISFRYIFKPSKFLGGDIFNYYLSEDRNNLIVYYLDVSGNGTAAALLAMMAHYALNIVIRSSDTALDPVETVAELNRKFQISENTVQYFTLFYAVISLNDLQMRFVQAGHRAFIHLPVNESPVFFETTGPPVGLFKEYQFQELSIALRPGDRFLVISDAVTEARGEKGEFFGENRLMESLSPSAGGKLPDLLEYLQKRLKDFRLSDTFDDDLTMIIGEIEAPEKTDKHVLKQSGCCSIVLIDDDPDIFRIVQFYLKNSEWTVTGFQNPSEALSYMKTENFDAVMLDQHLPGYTEDFHSLIREILKHRDFQDVPFIAVSSAECCSSGYDAVLQKPLDKHSLLAVLNRSRTEKKRRTASDRFNQAMAKLRPEYLEHRSAELSEMRKKIEEGNYALVESFGHKTRGSGASYGFNEISIIGGELEKAAEEKKYELVKELLDRLEKTVADEMEKLSVQI